ncbi:MAG: hypothetical protein WBB45_03815 [Cyclobacteriaceae bacterium]
MINKIELIVLIFTLNACGTIEAQSDIACLKEINTNILKELETDKSITHKFWKNDVELFVKLYVNEKGHADSISFAKSNLHRLGYNEDRLKINLMKYKYQCIRDVYYKNEPAPDYVIIKFNPNLIR